ncbi:hypothetical protein YDYSY3_31480 [Paenibacillus chitinolyticus]|uniref:hypothetical protein n=1 Tax=Paenibacillus chitinolyticus TaxID=79263 RepID=UPI0026E4C1D4|nr:hypothetical protein [Paenibacillus chitinolyticus]GKS12148.1 hypothetical protein YDYSY3_31480 [Paenibacillus chitinolyticus]
MKLIKWSILSFFLLAVSCLTVEKQPFKIEKRMEENEFTLLLKQDVEKSQGITLSDFEPQEIKHEGEDTFVYFFFTKDNQLHEGLSYLTFKDNAWKIIRTETALSLPDMEITNFQIGGATSGDAKKPYFVIAGYCTNDKINEIRMTDFRNDLFHLKLDKNKRTFLQVNMNSTVGIKEVQGIDADGKVIYRRGW